MYQFRQLPYISHIVYPRGGNGSRDVREEFGDTTSHPNAKFRRGLPGGQKKFPHFLRCTVPRSSAVGRPVHIRELVPNFYVLFPTNPGTGCRLFFFYGVNFFTKRPETLFLAFYDKTPPRIFVLSFPILLFIVIIGFRKSRP